MKAVCRCDQSIKIKGTNIEWNVFNRPLVLDSAERVIRGKWSASESDWGFIIDCNNGMITINDIGDEKYILYITRVELLLAIPGTEKYVSCYNWDDVFNFMIGQDDVIVKE